VILPTLNSYLNTLRSSLPSNPPSDSTSRVLDSPASPAIIVRTIDTTRIALPKANRLPIASPPPLVGLPPPLSPSLPPLSPLLPPYTSIEVEANPKRLTINDGDL
jgi:hypothetical protein